MANDPKASQASEAFGHRWNDLRAVTLFRWGLCTLLVALAISDKPHYILSGIEPELLPPLTGLYLLSALTLTIVWARRWPALPLQIQLQAWSDVLLLSALLYALGGMESGLGVLMATAVIGHSTLLSRGAVIPVALFAIICLMSEETLRELQGLTPGANYTLTGAISALMLLGALGGSVLADRARRATALVEEKTATVAGLERLNERIIQGMQTGAVVVDDQGLIHQCNRAASHLLRIGDEVNGMPLSRVSPALQRSYRGWRQREIVEGDGLPILVEGKRIQPHYLRLPGYEPAVTLISLQDLDLVNQRVVQIKQAALGRLTASIAHEIRNPLSAISQANQMLRSWQNTELEETRLLRMVEKNCIRIDRIVQDVLSLSQRQDANPTSLPLRTWLAALAEEYSAMHDNTNLQFEFGGIPEDLHIRFDVQHLRQIMENLWSNAAQYAARDQEPVRITHKGWYLPNQGVAHLEVSDNGPGIDDKVANQIFEPFYTSEAGGTGLGLYITRELCECNHAQIELRQEPDRGACFQISFLETWQQHAS